MYYYKLYGLIIKSDFKFPFISEYTSVQKYDVLIRKGKFAKKLPNILNKGLFYEANNIDFLFVLKGGPCFLLKEGKEILYSSEYKITEKDLYIFLTGTVFGALFQQRNKLALHGSCIQTCNGSVVFSGLSGVGKSGLAMYFMKKGYPVISDDISVFSKKGHDLFVHTGPPYLKIWENLLLKHDLKPIKYESVRDGLNKYIFPVKMESNTLQVKCLFVIKQVNRKSMNVVEVKGINKFEFIRRNVYKNQFLKNTHNEKNIFRELSHVANSIRLFVVERCNNLYFEEEIEQHVLASLYGGQ